MQLECGYRVDLIAGDCILLKLEAVDPLADR
jgi:hypothetical protein